MLVTMVETRTSIKFVCDFQIKLTETFNLLQTAKGTSELKHSTLFNDVQSVSHKEIAVKNNKKAEKFYDKQFKRHGMAWIILTSVVEIVIKLKFSIDMP